MNKRQFWILNVTSFVLAILLLSHYFLARSNEQLKVELSREEAVIGRSAQLDKALDNLVKRIAVGSDADPQLGDILRRYGLTVTIEKDGRKTTYPRPVQ